MNGTLPGAACRWLAERVADWHWRHAPRDRDVVQANLSIILGQAVPAHSPLIREVFHHFALYLVEFLRAHRPDRSPMAIEGREPLTAIVRSQKGAVILSAHMGNWEVGAIGLHQLGVPMSVVALPHRHPRVNHFFDQQRLRCGVQVIPLGVGATRQCLAWLRTGGFLGIAGDREFGSNGIQVSFFGRSAVLPRGPATLSLRTGVAAIPVFLIREGPWRLRFYTEPPIWPKTDGVDPVQELTQRYAEAIERIVRRFPTQWLMFQPLDRLVEPSGRPGGSPGRSRRLSHRASAVTRIP